MRTAPVMPPPRPPRDRNMATGAHDWHDNPYGGFRARYRRYGRMLAKLVVLVMFAVAVGQLALILFETVRLYFFS